MKLPWTKIKYVFLSLTVLSMCVHLFLKLQDNNGQFTGQEKVSIFGSDIW